MGEVSYLDASALVKCYVQEDGTDDVLGLLDQEPDVVASELVRVEVVGAIARAPRQDRLSEEEAAHAIAEFRQMRQNLRLMKVDEAVISRAESLAQKHLLKAFDAVHLATALVLQDQVMAVPTVACYDDALRQAAQHEGLPVWP